MGVAICHCVTEVKASLQLRAEAGHRPAGHCARRAQPIGRVAGPSASRGGQSLPAVTGRVDLERMKIDLTVVLSGENDPSRQPWLNGGRVPVTQLIQGAFGLLQVRPIQRDVDVAVLASLLADQGVHAPTAVQPEPDTGVLKCLDHLQQVVDRHHLPRHTAHVRGSVKHWQLAGEGGRDRPLRLRSSHR